jgi:hypothetical protein
MFITGFLIEISNGSMILGLVPESLALLIFGVGLVGSTFVLRRMFNRHDQEKALETTHDGN